MNSETNLPKFFFIYGIAIFPLLLLIGPLISELFLISVIFYSAFFILKENQFQFYQNRYFLFLEFFLFVNIVFNNIKSLSF